MARLLLTLIIAVGLQAGELKLGRPLTLDEPMKISDLLATPRDYVGKTVQVKGQRVTPEICSPPSTRMTSPLIQEASGCDSR